MKVVCFQGLSEHGKSDVRCSEKTKDIPLYLMTEQTGIVAGVHLYGETSGWNLGQAFCYPDWFHDPLGLFRRIQKIILK